MVAAMTALDSNANSNANSAMAQSDMKAPQRNVCGS
jgi:hypothetical protein